jgi:hypothetical protein
MGINKKQINLIIYYYMKLIEGEKGRKIRLNFFNKIYRKAGSEMALPFFVSILKMAADMSDSVK